MVITSLMLSTTPSAVNATNWIQHPVQIVSGWIHNGQASDVESVMVDGRWLMRDRTVLTIDEADVVTRAEAIGRRVCANWWSVT